MITPPGSAGRVVFSHAGDGDLRSDARARVELSQSYGIASEWATVNQVHGSALVRVSAPGTAGEGDALWTAEPGLPLAIFTADCLAVALQAPGAAGIAHAGWRGAAGGVVSGLRAAMADAGYAPERAFVGPGIGPCCFEVGPDVVDRFPRHLARTSWGSPSVDLPNSVRSSLDGLDVWSADVCTKHEPGWFSHRSDATPSRQAGITWT
ncbi:MAG: polyphenol oxidase family protein [Acidimicrobiia bacterium]